jgi:hypothetical protein
MSFAALPQMLYSVFVVSELDPCAGDQLVPS